MLDRDGSCGGPCWIVLDRVLDRVGSCAGPCWIVLDRGGIGNALIWNPCAGYALLSEGDFWPISDGR